MSDMLEIGWDDPSVVAKDPNQSSRKVERFTAKLHKTHRITVLTEKPLRSFTHYRKPYGYFACLKAEGLECIACAANDRVSEKFATNILVYPDGTEPGAPWDASKARVMMWQPGPKVFGDIRQIVRNWGALQNYDIEVHCTNEKYQHLNITPTPKLLWKEHPNAADIQAMIERDQYDLKKLVGGRKETVEEVRMIWSNPNITREQLKALREQSAPQTGGGYPPQGNPGMTPPPSGTASAPNFADLLRTGSR